MLLLVASCLAAGAAGTAVGLVAFGADVAPMPQPKDAGPVTFDQVVKAAAADARASGPLAPRTRYLSAAHLPPAERRELFRVTDYHVNGLSRGKKLRPVRPVTEWLWAVCLDDYKWDPKVWEDLKRVNTYFCIEVQVPQVSTRQVTRTVPKVVTDRAKKQRTVYRQDAYGRFVPYTEDYWEESSKTVQETVTETVTERGAAKVDFIPAPWLPTKESAELVALTGSATAIVRADQFLFETFAQADGRDGHGYYDFLGLGKSMDDAEKLAGLDRKRAIDAARETAAVADASGVALANRQLYRYETVGGPYWESRDAKNSKKRKNAVTHFRGDFDPDAFETVGTLPNRLPFFGLYNAARERQDTAPDFIASHRSSTNNDKRVHVGYSCVACHTDGGLHPIDDYIRKNYSPRTKLVLGGLSADPEESELVESAHFGPLGKVYARDTADFTEAIVEASGFDTAAKLSEAVRRRWTAYADDMVTLDRAAAEFGTTPDALQEAARRHKRAKGATDPLVGTYLPPAEKVPPMTRQNFEEMFPVVMLIVGGVDP